MKAKTGAPVNDDEELEAEADKMGSLAAGGSYSGDGSKSLGERGEAVSETIPEIIPEITPEESPRRSSIPPTEREVPPASGQPDEVVQKKSKNSGNILDIIVNVLDIVGFIPGIGDIADAVNTGIAIINVVVIFKCKAKVLDTSEYGSNYNDLLIGPEIVDSSYWSKGLFFTVANISIEPYEEELDYGFYSIGKGKYLKENGLELTHQPQILGTYGIATITTVARNIEKELIINPNLLTF